jgi:hypothetical protein
MKKWVLISLPFALFALLYFHNVPNDLTSADEEALAFYGRLNNTSHLDNVEMIETLLDQMQILIRKDHGIPKGQTREPEDLVRFRTGKCYDWCRTAYKFFKFHDIEVRYLSIYAHNGNYLNLLKPGIPSHAGLEIEMNGKWIYVDPFYGWIAKSSDNEYLSADDLFSDTGETLLHSVPKKIHDLMVQKPIVIYGLYSRHGRFYPPFTPIPDFSYSEFKLNF